MGAKCSEIRKLCQWCVYFNYQNQWKINKFDYKQLKNLQINFKKHEIIIHKDVCIIY